MTGPRILCLDIESSPALAWTYGLRNQFIGIHQIEMDHEVLGWSYRWYGSPKKTNVYEWSDTEGARDRLWQALDDADAVMGYNSKRFDIPMLNSMFVKYGVRDGQPYSPPSHIDLWLETKRNFRQLSTKLQWTSTALLKLQGKVDENALLLFLDMVHGDEKKRLKARARMERYCKQDVDLLPEVYDALGGWVNGVKFNLYDGSDGTSCPRCGNPKLQSRGTRAVGQSIYPEYRCGKCGKTLRGTRRVVGQQVVEAR